MYQRPSVIDFGKIPPENGRRFGVEDAVPEALGRRRMLEHEDGDVDEVMRFEFSFRLVTPVHERKRDCDGEQQTADHHQYLLHLILVVLLDLRALHVSVPSSTIV